MFVTAIEVAAEFTRPLHVISRTYQSNAVVPGAATLFIVNSDGWALTCAHVARQLLQAEQVIAGYGKFKTELSQLPKGKNAKAWRRELERKYQYTRDTTVQLLNLFVNCVADMKGFEIKMHPELDVALLRFDGFSKLTCSKFPVFAANGADLKQGKSICRLGFPFPEFNNFEYDSTQDIIQWTDSGRTDTPRFPIEGMVTRHLNSAKGIVGFELSTPGLRGQSGGPAFDTEGRVWGMQASTAHLDLSFDIDQQVVRGGTKKRVTDHAFLHVGHCMHVDMLKDFMKANQVAFAEG